MLSEFNTFTLIRLDTSTFGFVIWIMLKYWEYQRYLLSNFFSLNTRVTETTTLEKQTKGCNETIQIYLFVPDGFNGKVNLQ